MIRFTPTARQQVRDLYRHFEDHDRIEAVRGLASALKTACKKIEADPDAGLKAPRPYPQLGRSGRLWIKAGRYWIAYGPAQCTIVGVFYDTADIPSRL